MDRAVLGVCASPSTQPDLNPSLPLPSRDRSRDQRGQYFLLNADLNLATHDVLIAIRVHAYEPSRPCGSNLEYNVAHPTLPPHLMVATGLAPSHFMYADLLPGCLRDSCTPLSTGLIGRFTFLNKTRTGSFQW